MTVLTNEGLERRARRAFSDTYSPFTYLALGLDTKVEDNSDSTLGNEVTSGGCARALATLAYEASYKGTWVKQWTVTDTFAIEEIGLFDNSTLLIVEDCEDDAWDELVDGDVTSTLDAVTFKVGTKSCKLAVAAGCGAGDILATEVVAKDLTTYEYVNMWLRSTTALDSGDLALLLDDHAQCASPTETIDIPAVGADTWTLVQCDLADPSACGSIISIGIKMVVDKGAFDLFVDHVHAPGTMLMRHKYAATRNIQNGDTLQITAKQTESRA